jgi:nuclear pore complex protein Nup107
VTVCPYIAQYTTDTYTFFYLSQSGERKAQRDAQRCLILGRTRELVQEVVPRWVFPSVSSVGQNGEDSQNTETNNTHPQAKPNPALLRFATHLLLFLQQSLPENGSGLRGNGPLHFHVNKVVNLYVVHLIATRRYALVPRYAAHLAKATLVETYTRFLTLLAPTDLGTKKRILKEACQWIAVDGDEDEETHDDEPHVGVRAIVAKTMHDSRLVVLWDGSERSGGAFSGRRVFGAGAARGPEHRENILEWALSLAKTRMHAEAATHACALVRQLCLSRTSRALDFENRRRDGDPVSGTTNQSENSENFSSGESRARHLVAELLPPDLQRNASESDAPGAAAELGDWASYLAGTYLHFPNPASLLRD